MNAPQRKRGLEEHLRAAEAREDWPTLPVQLVLDNVRSLHNVGSLFRTADGFGIRKLQLLGFTPAPPRPEIAKTAIGAEEVVPFETIEDPAVAMLRLEAEGYQLVALEQTTASESIYDFDFRFPVAIVLGHETDGVSDEVLARVEATVEIPMLGVKHSHNVAVAGGIVLGEVYRRWVRSQGASPREACAP